LKIFLKFFCRRPIITMTAISLTNHPIAESGSTTPVTPLKGKQPVSEARKTQIRNAAVEFQAIFVEMMLKSMRDTTNQDKLTGGGHGEEVYGSLLDREYATAISRRGNMGLADMIEQQLLAQENGGEKKLNNSNTTGITDKGNIEASHEN
jgi:Rod binding domain-containing protein